MAYMNVDEIESALQTLASNNPGSAELIMLPNPTSEGRRSHALRVGPALEDVGSAFRADGHEAELLIKHVLSRRLAIAAGQQAGLFKDVPDRQIGQRPFMAFALDVGTDVLLRGRGGCG